MLQVVAVMVAACTLVVIAWPNSGLKLPLHYNLSDSLPRGLYHSTVQDTLSRGAIMRTCVPEHSARRARARGYLGPGPCAGDTARIAKMVIALPGDTVIVRRDSVHVGSRLRLSMPIRERDSRGRPIRGAIGAYVLHSGECFVLGTNRRRSYDSRYFGLVACKQPFVVLQPISRQAREEVGRMRQLLRDAS